AFLAQHGRAARPPLAEMKIVADHDAADPQPSDQFAKDELFGGAAGESRVEGLYHHTVEAGCREEPELGRLRREPEGRRVRHEEAAGMRLEGERKGRESAGAGAVEGEAERGAMAAVQAVEIADRNPSARK